MTTAKVGRGHPAHRIRTLKRLRAEGCDATPEEQLVMARYVGWGLNAGREVQHPLWWSQLLSDWLIL